MIDPIIQSISDQLQDLRDRLAGLERVQVNKPGTLGTPIYPGLTAGRVVFVGSDLSLSDDSGLVWDSTNNYLGVGASPSQASLDVSRGTGTNGAAIIRGTTNASHFNFSTTEDTYIRGGKNTSHVILNDTGANVGVGTAAPTAKLDVTGGYIRAREGANTPPTSAQGIEFVFPSGGTNTGYILSYSRDASLYRPLELHGGALSLLHPGGGLTLNISGAGAAVSTNIEIGQSATGNRNGWIDIRGDDTYTDFGLRVIRNATGANTTSQIVHRGTGSLDLVAVDAGAITFYTSNTFRWLINSAGDLLPNGAGALSIGSAVAYVNDVSYKTLTDRGCLALIDSWEMLDGRKLSNLEVIRDMKAHATEKTIYGEVKLDYASVPRHSHKPAPIADEDTEIGGKRFKKGQKVGEDGVEMTSMFSVMLGAIRELAGVNDSLVDRISKLEQKGTK